MLKEIDAKGEDPVEHVKAMFAAKEEDFGFGHRVYHTEDPRATFPSPHVGRTRQEQRNAEWFDMSRKIELCVKAEKKLNAKRGFLLRLDVSHAWHRRGFVHADFRCLANCRLGRARHRAA